MPIRITSTTPGFRRAGIAHPVGPTDYPNDKFSVAQLAQLKSEPRLFIEVVKDSPADTGIDQKGTLDDERLAELVGYIGQMDRENTELWRQDNSPKAGAYPVSTTAEERDAAWDAFTAQLDSSDA